MPSVSITLRDHVIIPGWRYEQLLRLDTALKLGLLRWRDEPEASLLRDSPPPGAQPPGGAQDDRDPPSPTRVTVMGAPPGFEPIGNAVAEEAAMLKQLGLLKDDDQTEHDEPEQGDTDATGPEQSA